MKIKTAAILLIFTFGANIANAKAQNSEYYPEDAIGAPRIGAQYTQIGKLWPIDSSPAVPSKQKCNWSLPDGPEDTSMGCSYKDFKNIIYDVEGTKIIAIHVTPDAENVWYSKLPFPSVRGGKQQHCQDPFGSIAAIPLCAFRPWCGWASSGGAPRSWRQHRSRRRGRPQDP